jgi:serine/threonine-protein kinase RsbT
MESHVQIQHESDIVTARQRGRKLAELIGFTGSQLTLIATAISEVARNILVYAQHGEIVLDTVDQDGQSGIIIKAQDEGPGIADVGLALQDGYSTGNSLGLGLPGAKRMMDEFHITSAPGRGTTIIMKKWVP